MIVGDYYKRIDKDEQAKRYYTWAMNHSKEMLEKIKDAKTLLYLGDNCGEIVIDKIFIKRLKQMNPELNVYYGVRGKTIVNDDLLQRM